MYNFLYKSFDISEGIKNYLSNYIIGGDILSGYIDNIIADKFREIQDRLPSSVKLFDNVEPFQEILNKLYIEVPINTYGETKSTSNIQENYPIAKKADIEEIKKLIDDAGKKYNVDTKLINSIIKAESNFNQFSVSKAGAMGLMQLMPNTARELGVTDPFNASQNIDGGVRYLKSLLDTYKNVSEALAAYNAGPAAVDKFKGIPPYEETIDYVNKILNDLGSK